LTSTESVKRTAMQWRFAVTRKMMSNGLLREKKTVKAMVEIYCRGNDHACREHESCESCSDLLRYAHERLDKCVFGEEKPVCALCPVHCYHPARRNEISHVMRYSGPKMFLRHPFLALSHLFTGNTKPGEKVQKYLERKKSRQADERRRLTSVA